MTVTPGCGNFRVILLLKGMVPKYFVVVTVCAGMLWDLREEKKSVVTVSEV